MRGTSESPRAASAGEEGSTAPARPGDRGFPRPSAFETGKRGNRGVFAFFVLLVHLASEAEVDDLGHAAIAYQDVRRLEVSMHEIATLESHGSMQRTHLHVEKAAQQLIQERFDVALTPALNVVVIFNNF